jgi:hypothetical protein
MRSYYSIALGALLSVVVSIPAHAETDLTGKWVGQFSGVQIEIPPERGPFGYPQEESKGAQTPRFVEQSLQLDIETQSKGIGSGNLDSRRIQKALRLRTDQSGCLELYRFWRPRQRRGHFAN